MPLAVLTEGPPLHPYTWEVDRPVFPMPFAGGGEQRVSLLSRELRTYVLRFRRTEAERIAFDAFFESVGWSLTSFLWTDLKDSTRGSGSPGLVTLDALGSDVYRIPRTGPYGGDYPIDDSNVKVWDSLSALQTNVAVDTDARTIEVTAGGTPPMKADYHYHRRVRLQDPYSWNEPAFGVFFTEIALAETVPNG